MEGLLQWLDALPLWQVLAYGVGGAIVVQFVVLKLITLFTRRTKTRLDDQIISAVRWPLLITLLFVAGAVTLGNIEWTETVAAEAEADADAAAETTITVRFAKTRTFRVLVRLLSTVAMWLWFRAFTKVSDAVLAALARQADDAPWIQPRTLPLFELVAKLTLFGGAIFAFLKIWHLDPSAWLASAGILGLAIGFAAKDTLANLFAGIFIIADAPYQLGDFVNLDTGERGRVTDIGLRSTRLLTRDDVEVTIPNSVMANTKIVNETQGPAPKRRIRVNVGVAYDSDLDRVREVLLDVAKACDYVTDDPPPSVRVQAFADSSIDVQLRGHIPQPVLRGRARDALFTGIHKKFAEAGIEIPFPQRVVQMTKDPD